MNIRKLGIINALSAKKTPTEVKNENGNQKITQQCDLNNAPNGYYSKIEVKKVAPVQEKEAVKHTKNNYIGCLLGGAIGDALGWPVEFRKLNDIRRQYGQEGITDLELVGKKAEITDDTQMTMFTADGLLKSAIENFDEQETPDMSKVFNSYQNWLGTQYGHYKKNNNGWISNVKDLYANRAPGTTCISAIQGGRPGSIENHINGSKGCGGVMRVAPAGLMYYKNPEKAFEVGARCAALTHGDPSAYLPAGVHSAIIANLVNGQGLEESVDNSIEILKGYEGNEETLELLEAAKEYAKSDMPTDTAISLLGEGWRGDEAIAMSVYCALKSPEDFEKALILAVNHNGDSDSTGAITGNILGAYLGSDKIPEKWKNTVELSTELEQLALDLYNKPSEIENAKERYIL